MTLAERKKVLEELGWDSTTIYKQVDLTQSNKQIEQQNCEHKYGEWKQHSTTQTEQYYDRSIAPGRSYDSYGELRYRKVPVIEWYITCRICGHKETTCNVNDTISED